MPIIGSGWEVKMRKQGNVIEIDCPVGVDDLAPDTEVKVLLQKCPHCGEWTAGPLGDENHYFCCGESMDPFVEVAGEVEIIGRVTRVAGGGQELHDMVEALTDADREELRRRWVSGQAWIPAAEELYQRRKENRQRSAHPSDVMLDLFQAPPAGEADDEDEEIR
jgi:hypothetical protein